MLAVEEVIVALTSTTICEIFLTNTKHNTLCRHVIRNTHNIVTKTIAAIIGYLLLLGSARQAVSTALSTRADERVMLMINIILNLC